MLLFSRFRVTKTVKPGARLIDFAADSCFLVQLIRFIVKGELEKGDLFPFVRGIAEDVIIKKTLSAGPCTSSAALRVCSAETFGWR
jgi:hypothetical protein